MSNERIRTYEGMFLFPQSATANLQEAADHVKGILDRCGATIVSFQKWDDRRLAYEVQGNKRGVYFLAYFTAPTTALAEIERRCNLSEELLRTMVTSAEHIPTEIIEANEGQEDLAAEIKLRSEKKSDSGSKSASKISKKSEEKAAKAEADKSDEVDEVVEEAVEDSKTAPESTEEVSTEA
ncbi:MAG: 30S ribosomal protein S6 [Planctomycetes bacterium]|nr:30S ribosomal protein S6 [Planctomycetota bacterium]